MPDALPDWAAMAKAGLTAFCLAALWTWETFLPLIAARPSRWRHAGRNVTISLLNTVVLGSLFGTLQRNWWKVQVLAAKANGATRLGVAIHQVAPAIKLEGATLIELLTQECTTALNPGLRPERERPSRSAISCCGNPEISDSLTASSYWGGSCRINSSSQRAALAWR